MLRTWLRALAGRPMAPPSSPRAERPALPSARFEVSAPDGWVIATLRNPLRVAVDFDLHWTPPGAFSPNTMRASIGPEGHDYYCVQLAAGTDITVSIAGQIVGTFRPEPETI